LPFDVFLGVRIKIVEENLSLYQKMKEAIIISLSKDIREISKLAESLGCKVIKTFIQSRRKPEVNFWIGKGKIKEIKEFLDQTPPPFISNGKVVIINGRLRPTQQFKLERLLKTQVYDRLRLILEIFADRARSKEAKLQVKLAKLRYEVPYIRELIHRTKIGEHPGYLAGGEYKVEDYYELIRKQIKRIKEDLEHLRLQRGVRRKARREKGFYLISIAGYANAGKSTLLMQLSGAKVEIDNRLFTTLSPKTQRFLAICQVLLTDTVGFIEGMPDWLIDAFRSTYEEIELADCIILVIDMKDEVEQIINKTKVALSQLLEWDTKSTIILALNKIDLLKRMDLELKRQGVGSEDILKSFESVPISAKEGWGIEELIDIISHKLPDLFHLKIQVLPAEASPLISWLHREAKIKSIKYEELVEIDLECSLATKQRLESMNKYKIRKAT
jgi:GTP-binding protein HflX